MTSPYPHQVATGTATAQKGHNGLATYNVYDANTDMGPSPFYTLTITGGHFLSLEFARLPDGNTITPESAGAKNKDMVVKFPLKKSQTGTFQAVFGASAPGPGSLQWTLTSVSDPTGMYGKDDA